MTNDRLHRPRHHGQPDGRPPGQGRARRRPASTAPRATPSSLVDGGGPRGGLDRRGRRGRRRRRRHGARLARRRARSSPGEGGVFDNAKPGTLVIDFSSIRPDVTVELAEAGRGARLPAARRPGLRRRGRAPSTRSLSIMVGGDAEDFEEAQPLLDAVGKTIVHVGRSGSGQTVKAANQLIVAANIQVLAEAVVFLEAYGVDTEAALEVLGGGLAGSKVLDQKKQNMLNRSFEPGFRIDLHHKDMGIVTSAAREAGVVVPLGALVAQLMASARANGDGGLDHSALLQGRRAAHRPQRRSRRHDPYALPSDAGGRDPREGGRHPGLRAAGRGDQPVLPRHEGPRRHQAHPRPPRRGRLAHGRGLHPRQGRQHRRLHRHLRPGRHRHDHRPVLRDRRLHPDPVHHRPGAGRQAAQGGLPGRRHRRRSPGRSPSGRSPCWSRRRCRAPSRRRSS